MQKLFPVALALLLFIAAPVRADDTHEHAHDHDHASQHGGQHGGVVVESGHHHLEVIAKDGVLEVHVVGEEGKPESVDNASATAAVLSDGKKVDVQLAPDGDHVLKGSGGFKAAAGTVIILTLKMPDHDPEQVRLTLK